MALLAALKDSRRVAKLGAGPRAGTARDDAKRAAAAVDLALSVPSISSQLVDNLNASIHLRALLTSLFLVDEAMRKS